MIPQPPPQPRRRSPDARIVRPAEQPQRYVLPSPVESSLFPERMGEPLLVAGGRELLTTVLPAVLLALLIQLFLAQPTRVESYSMEPTLIENQRLIIDKVSYHLNPPQRGDIVVLRSPDGGTIPLVKRVVALGGETIAVQGGQVLIDGRPLSEPYLRSFMHGSYGPVRVPAASVFVMGDNRDHSHDSRAFGPVPLDSLVGRAWLRYWPPQQAGLFQHE